MSVFDVGEAASYFTDDHDRNKKIFQKVAQKSYIPMLQLLLKLTQEVETFRFSLSCSGVFLEQAQEYEPKVIILLQKLAATQKVEFLSETYYHSLAALYSPTEFKEQVKLHTECMQTLFNVTPTVFRNTELIYSNDIAKQVAALGFQGMLTEAVERYLHGRPKTRVYRSAGSEALPLLLKHAEFSDDLAFRFSDVNWPEYPLTVEKYSSWLSGYYDEEIINLFMDFETFGEHQWRDTGIFDFFKRLIHRYANSEQTRFITPSEAIAAAVSVDKLRTVQKDKSLLQKIIGLFTPRGLQGRNDSAKSKEITAPNTQYSIPTYDVPEPISWADVDRDLTAWTENPLQQDTLKKIYELRITNDEQLLDIWRKLQTSDHFYYMCTKWAADGDVHAYFSPYETPYEAYRNYCIALTDLNSKV